MTMIRMSGEKPSYQNLSSDLLLKTLSYVSLEEILQIFSIDKKTHYVLNNPYFWKDRCQTYFPRQVEREPADVKMDWKASFKNYVSPFPREWKLRILVQEQNLAVIKEKNLTYNDILMGKDSDQLNLLDLAVKKNNQNICDYFYKKIAHATMAMDEIESAIRCRQPLENIQSLIKTKSDLAVHLQKKYLFAAIRAGYLELVQYALEKNDKLINEREYDSSKTPLQCAMEYEQLHLVQYLVNQKNIIISQSELKLALRINHTDIAKLLLARVQFNVLDFCKESKIFDELLWFGCLNSLRLLMESMPELLHTQSRFGCPQLAAAVCCWNLSSVEFILQQKDVDINASFKDAFLGEINALKLSIMCEKYEITKALLKADASVKNIVIDEKM
ncbi:MAG TPA: ankyrin repeat domain-containing protein, partial [Gammaproteobacteria bacterium]|nr:ankyrin repeat domain-containing protein [Gammaproteobacteria bacterium]